MDTQEGRERLSKSRVERAKHAPDRDVFLWDERLPGFGVRVLPSGKRTYLIQYRAKGRTRRLALGQHGTLTLEQARTLAIRHLAAVRGGGDPSAERHESREAATFAELGERYLAQHARPKKKASSAAEDERILKRYLLPKFGPRRAADITRSDVDRLHSAMQKTPIMANRALFLLSTLMNLAEKWDLRPRASNPCYGVERYRERARKRYLSQTELARVGDELRKLEAAFRAGRDPRREVSEHPSAIAAIRLLILTGARVSEITTCHWSHVKWDRAVLDLPDSKTGQKVIPLSAPALEVLAKLYERRSGPWVIEDETTGENALGKTGVGKAWRRIRKRAELEDVHLHDLRHTHASVGVGAGLSLPLIGALLGHRSSETTQRYAHLSDDPVRAASELVGGRLAALLSGAPAAPVVPIRGAS
jgi:integrase